MKYDLVISGGTIVTATDIFQGDIGIRGEKIEEIGREIKTDSETKKINAKGKYVIPGGIDVHVHFQLPFCGTVSADDFVTGTRAAAVGGVTTVIDFAMQDKEKGIIAGIEKRRGEAEGRVCVDYSLHSILIGYSEKTEKEIPRAIDYGVPTFKMFMIYESEGWQSNDGALFRALEQTKNNGSTILVHAESEGVMKILIERRLVEKKKVGAYGHVLSRPNFIEEEAVERASFWAEATGGRLYFVHLSTAEAADIVKSARLKGNSVFAETCVQYLVLTDEVFKDKKTGHLYATCPQIKKKKDQERLWRAITDGELGIVSTDTCTFTKKQKAMWNGDFTKIPYGIPGVETLLPAVYTNGVLRGRFNLNRFVSLISTNPAKLMGLYPKKGAILPGSDADLIIFDPGKKKIIDYREMETNCDWSPYQGMKMAGFPDITILRGKVIVRDGKFIGKEGDGEFVKRKPSGEI